MHRLFWKLFLGYWLALIVFSGCTLFAASLYLERVRSKQHESPRIQHEFPTIAASARAAVAAHGKQGLIEWATEADEGDLVPVMVLDKNGRDLLNRVVSARPLAHLQQHLRLMREGRNSDEDAHHGVRMPDGSEYWLVRDYREASLGRFLTRPKVLAVPMALAALVGAIVCLLLAHYLAAPVERLRRASQAYASGDFSHRVGPSLGRRRDEIVDLAHALDEMAERLDLILTSQRMLLRDVSHELRSPLARVQAALGLARQNGGNNEIQLDRIERETERLGELIGEILNYSRLTSGIQDVKRTQLDLNQLLSDVVEDANLEGSVKAIRVKFDNEEMAPFDGCISILQSALENVLRNAVQHAPAASQVEVSLARETTNLRFSDYVIRVRDHGPGVPDDMLDSIFDPFVRVEANRDHRGIGLGLAIAKRALQTHCGKIQAENAVGGGLVMTIRLPLSNPAL